MKLEHDIVIMGLLLCPYKEVVVDVKPNCKPTHHAAAERVIRHMYHHLEEDEIVVVID